SARGAAGAAAPLAPAGSVELLVATHSEDLGDLGEELSAGPPDLVVYAHCLQWTYDQPILPEVAGLMAQMAKMPWEERLRVAEEEGGERKIVKLPPDARPAAELAARLVEEAEAAPANAAVGEMTAFYAGRRDLRLGGAEPGERRRIFRCASPVPGARFG
ncbi:MAG: hypothetical protein HZA54_03285, partial [Planctomycetes bacterium]|nr:hypothetical protein [Planctomycetota bacterium]